MRYHRAESFPPCYPQRVEMHVPAEVLFFALHVFGVARCFLYHEQNVKEFSESEAKYYGYSVLLQKGTPSKLVVGSPFDGDVGSVYINDVDSGSKQRFAPNHFVGENQPKNFLFGAAMDGGTTVGESVMVCQPKYQISHQVGNELSYFANGGCVAFWNINDTTTYQYIYPNSERNLQITGTKYFLAFGQAGMSVRYMDNYKEFIVGSPGIFNWAGGAIKMSEREVALPPQTREVKPARRRQPKLRRSDKYNVEYTYERLPQLKYNVLSEYDADYAGYSIAYGEIVKGKKFFIVGTPRSNDLVGSVLYINTETNDGIVTLQGPAKIGSYFGSSLCVLDINGDGFDDLLVGAPMQRDTTHNEGFVHQYINGQNGDLRRLSEITTSKRNGHFGTAMSNLGKVTLDSFDSVAISSPYENDGRGAVYVYVGSKDGLKYSQRIEASPNALGFGYSLSRAVDVDNNNASDLAVGAYKSRTSYVLFARPIFHYAIRFEDNARLYSFQKNAPFKVNYCVEVVGGRGIGAVLTNVTVNFDKRLTNRPISEKKEINGEVCHYVSATLIENVQDMETPVSVEVLVAEEDCPKCPVSSPTYSRSESLRIPFLYNCGDDQICTPDFEIANDIVDTYTVGSEGDVSLTVNIRNKGEYAYICRLRLDLPTDVSIRSASKNCNNNNCVLQNPIENADSKEFKLDLSEFLHVADSMTFKVFVDCLNYTKTSTTTVKLLYKSAVYTEGTTKDIIYKNKNHTADGRGKFEYFIKNNGPSPLENFNFKFAIPKSYNKQDIVDVYQPKISNVDVTCVPSVEYAVKSEENTSNREADVVKSAQAVTFKPEEISCSGGAIECMEVRCMVRRLLKNSDIKISFPVRPNIDLILKDYQSTFQLVSHVTYELESQTHIFESRIILRDNEEGTYISYWAIILGTIIGIIILAAIIVLLVKLGFFKRIKYDKMEEQKLQDKSEEMVELSEAGKSTEDR